MKLNIKNGDISLTVKSEGELSVNDVKLVTSLVDIFMGEKNFQEFLEEEKVQKIRCGVSNNAPNKNDTALLNSSLEELKPLPTNYEPFKYPKKLVFVKCPNCGDTFCKMVDISENKEAEILCKCNETIVVSYADTYKGSYECNCGTKGIFRMTEDVSQIKCKDCEEFVYMVQDEVTKEYKGVLV